MPDKETVGAVPTGKAGKSTMDALLCKPEFVYIGKVKPDVRWHNRHRVHDRHELIVILGGVMHISDRERRLELRTGDAALYPAGTPHWEHSDENEPAESCFLVFRDPNFSGDRILVNRDRGDFLRPLAAALYEQSVSGEHFLFGNAILELMLKVFFTPSVPEPKTSVMVREADTFMRRNLGGAISLDDIAEAAGISRYHFLRRYRLETGKTPIRVLWEMRCAEAISLLKYTVLPIKEIALRTGFADSAHLSRRIKAFSGKSPRRFREE